MRKLKINYNMSGVFYQTRRLLKFRNTNELVTENDLINLFVGFVRLIKKSAQLEIEEKYLKKINSLEKEIQLLKRIN